MCEQIFSGPQNYCANMAAMKGNRGDAIWSGKFPTDRKVNVPFSTFICIYVQFDNKIV